MGQVTEDEFKLSLELSIGGCYANSGNEREKGTANENINRRISISGSGFYKNDRGEQRKREIQELAGMDGEQRKTQERDGIPKRKRIEGEKLNTSMFGENNVCACPWVVPLYVERDGNSSGDDIAAAPPCSSHRGRSSDSGSQSSTHTQKQQQISSTSDYKVVADASSPNTTKTLIQPPKTTIPPPPSNHMPCVSATGPNAKTITGFLCKYTKSEVTIMCGCHGSFFSPAQFLQHAGAVDVTHPLRHITVLPSLLKR